MLSIIGNSNLDCFVPVFSHAAEPHVPGYTQGQICQSRKLRAAGLRTGETRVWPNQSTDTNGARCKLKLAAVLDLYKGRKAMVSQVLTLPFL